MAVVVAKILLMLFALVCALVLGYLARDRKATPEAERGDPAASIFAAFLLVLALGCGLIVVFS